MVERIKVELYLDSENLLVRRLPAGPNNILVEAGKSFSFELCRKQTSMGEVPVDQFWLEISSVYGVQNRRARNYDVIVEFFWALCGMHDTTKDVGVQESYILAKLLPYTRLKGTKRVFNDAVINQSYRVYKDHQNILRELDAQLSQYRQQELDLVEFRDKTAIILGPPDYGDEIQRIYWQMANDLLRKGREALQRDGPAGLEVPFQHWRAWMKSFGRHRGHELEKQVLDILSYECRAALHRCYSSAWCELLPHLAKEYVLSQESIDFHQLWNLDLCSAPDEDQPRSFLFHGHVFALHPAAGTFISTRTGASLIGDWLENPSGNGPTFRRFLHGMMIALNHYAVRHETYAELRRKDSRFINDDIESMPAKQLNRGRHRRERHVPRDD